MLSKTEALFIIGSAFRKRFKELVEEIRKNKEYSAEQVLNIFQDLYDDITYQILRFNAKEEKEEVKNESN